MSTHPERRQTVRQFADSRSITMVAMATLAIVGGGIVALVSRGTWHLASLGFAFGSVLQLLIFQRRLRDAFRRGELEARR